MRVYIALKPFVVRFEQGVQRLLSEPERGRAIYPVLLLILVLLAWFPILFTGIDASNPDDFYHITQAALRHSPREVASWFTRGYWAYTHFEYRPLTRLSLLLNYFLVGPRPWGYHLVNLLLHFGSVWLVAAILVRAGAPIWAARLSGLIAAVFPSGQRAVAWINGRQDLLCGLLMLASLLFFLRWLTGGSRRIALGAVSGALLAALAKEPGATMPILFTAAALLIPNRRSISAKLIVIGFTALLLAPYAMLRLQAWPMAAYLENNAPQLRSHRVALIWLFRDLLLPRPYELVTVWPQQGWHIFFSPLFPRMFIEQVAFWIGLPFLLLRRPRLLVLGVIWQIILFLPVANLYWNPSFTHYRYLPHLGTAALAGLAAWEAACWASKRLRPSLPIPITRYALVALGFSLLINYYAGKVEGRWPSWELIKQGGVPPPASFTRTFARDTPFHFPEEAIYPPGERPSEIH